MKAIKYLSRIDSGTTHCWIVRVMIGKPEQIYKTFTDGRYLVGNDWEQAKKDSKLAAIIFKNKMLKKYKIIMEQYRKTYIKNNKRSSYDKLKKPPLFKKRQYKVKTAIRKNGSIYRYFNLSVSNKYDKTITYMRFNMKPLGIRKTKELAIQWVNEKRKLVLKTARQRGIKC